jgi:hypothetical protein
VTEIMSTDGSVVAKFYHNINDLAPSQTVSLTGTWNPANVTAGTYLANAYVLHNGMATAPKTTVIQVLGTQPTPAPSSSTSNFPPAPKNLYDSQLIVAIGIEITIVAVATVLAAKQRHRKSK